MAKTKYNKRDILEAYIIAETQKEKNILGQVAEIITSDMLPLKEYVFKDKNSNIIIIS